MHSAAKTPLPGCPTAAGTTRSGCGEVRPAGRGARDATLAVAVCWLIGGFPSWCGVAAVGRVRSAARRRTEADRGLAACSSGLASSAPRVSSRRYAACSGSSTGRPCGAAALGAGGEHALGDAVLERVVGQDGDPAADGERVDRAGQRRGPDRQLGVDLDAQGLEGALARVPAALLRRGRDDLLEQVDQPARGGERLALALADDGRRRSCGRTAPRRSRAAPSRGRPRRRC